MPVADISVVNGVTLIAVSSSSRNIRSASLGFTMPSDTELYIYNSRGEIIYTDKTVVFADYEFDGTPATSVQDLCEQMIASGISQ